jgi:hypothetical protein
MTDAAAQAAPWIVTAGTVAVALVREVFGRANKQDAAVLALLKSCNDKHDQRDAKDAERDVRMEALIADVARLTEAHRPCAPAISALRREIQALRRDSKTPPGLPVQHEEVGGHDE